MDNLFIGGPLVPKRSRLEKADDLKLIPPRGMVLFRIKMEKEFIEPEQDYYTLLIRRKVDIM